MVANCSYRVLPQVQGSVLLWTMKCFYRVVGGWICVFMCVCVCVNLCMPESETGLLHSKSTKMKVQRHMHETLPFSWTFFMSSYLIHFCVQMKEWLKCVSYLNLNDSVKLF